MVRVHVGVKWKWIVLAASFSSTVANSTIFCAFGTFVLPWIEEFDTSAASIAFVTSCGSSISAMACPIASFIVQRWSYRRAHVIGGILLVLSFSTSSLVQSLGQMFLTYSVIGGFGSSLCMVSYTNAIREHFQNNQPLAFALVTSAYGIGGFVFPLYFDGLIEGYGWRGAMLITSAVFGNVVACGLLLWPPSLENELLCFEGSELDFSEHKNSFGLKNKTVHYSDNCPVEDRALKDVDVSLTASTRKIQITESSVCLKLFSVCALDSRKHDENFNIKYDDSKKDVEGNFFQLTKVLLKSRTFYIVLVHNIATYMGFFTVFALTPVRASYDLNLTNDQAFVLVSAIGIPQSIFRVVYGVVVALKWVKASTIFLIAFITGGILTILSIAAKTYALQIMYCLGFSTCFAAVAFYSVMVIKQYDNNLFNISFGYLEAMHGVGIIAGPTIGGLLFDLTGTTTYSFAFAGFSIIFGILILPFGLALSGKLDKLNF